MTGPTSTYPQEGSAGMRAEQPERERNKSKLEHPARLRNDAPFRQSESREQPIGDENRVYEQILRPSGGRQGSSDLRTTESHPASSGEDSDYVESLRLENAMLRIALEVARGKLQGKKTQGDGGAGGGEASGGAQGRKDGHCEGGVALVLMRRLLLKDSGFFRDSFLPFLDLVDLGRSSRVCRGFRKAVYEPEVISRCISTGGVTASIRSRFWMIMAGMDPLPSSSHGVLGVMALSPPERVDPPPSRAQLGGVVAALL
ncbi:unnamed protein product [Discosporangium mesarthrocarpum]